MAELRAVSVPGIPEVRTGDDLATLTAQACSAAGLTVLPGDIVVISSKVVSKAAGLWAGDRAQAVADSTRRVVAERATHTHVTRVVESTAGPVMAAGGVDASNTGGREEVLLLPADPDAAAAGLLESLATAFGLEVGELGVIVTDTAGRPWRGGQTDFALGAAGLLVLDDLRGSVDADGRPLGVTARAVADEIAAAADLVKGKQDHAPIAIVRGLAHFVGGPGGSIGAARLVRTGPGDWFRLGHVEAVRAALGVEPGSTLAQECGILALHRETLAERVARAVRLALVDQDARCDIAPDGKEVLVRHAGPYVLGHVVARLEAALWAEDLSVAARSAGPDPESPRVVRLALVEAADGPTR